MGVRLPIERRSPARERERAAQEPGRSQIHGTRHRRGGPFARNALWHGALAIALLALGVVAAYYFGRIPPPLTVWEVASASKISSGESGFLLSTPSGLAIGKTDGAVTPVHMEADEALLVGDVVVAVCDGDILAAKPDLPVKSIAAAFPDEVMSGSGNECFYTGRPQGGLLFGTNWILRRITLDGRIDWEAAVTGVPVNCVEKGNKVFVAVNDLLSGTKAQVCALDKANGRLLWEHDAGDGFWRALFARKDGTAVAVVDDSLRALSPDGELLWTYDPPGKITSAAEIGEAFALCYEPLGVAGKLMTPTVAMISSTGQLVWTKGPAGRIIGVSAWEGPTSDRKEDCFVALFESHVVGLSQGDGTEVWRNSTGGQPVELLGEFLLVSRKEGLRLVRLPGPSS